MILETIKDPKDIKTLTKKEKKLLATEIRSFLIDKISKTGGHFASNLGVVEITIALLSSFDFTKDKIIFDVGHQSYVYKLLTGRKNQFDTLRKYKGLRGFPYPKESSYDFFETGHSSTSISAGLGMARARDLKKENFHVISFIGDGSISNGMSLEAINDLGFHKTKMIIILNDNGMSISSNVGGISSYLSQISMNSKYLHIKNKVKHCMDGVEWLEFTNKILTRLKDGIRTFLVPSKYFEEMGLTYIGPLDGHDISLLTKVLKKAKKIDNPVIIHIVTKKGLGYEKAMETPDIYHAVSPFDKELGVLPNKKETYSSSFGKSMEQLAYKYPNLVAITAAMKDGVGLRHFFELYPERSFDVGIAEEHAVTFSAGLSKEGMIPVLAIYSTFLQRGFDQIIHDVCMQNCHVIFAIDRAGIVGNDGETHQGIFDIAYLSLIPNLTILAPKTLKEMKVFLEWAIQHDGPVAIRYPRGGDDISLEPIKKLSYGSFEVLEKGKKATIIATGKMVGLAIQAKKKYHLDVEIIHTTFLKPMDEKIIRRIAQNSTPVLTIEDGTLIGGMGANIVRELSKYSYKGKIIQMGYPDKFIEQGSISELYEQEHLTVEDIYQNIQKLIK